MDDNELAIHKFKEAHGVEHIIAFSGGADSTADDARVKAVINDAIEALRSAHVAILTGGTVKGVPQMAAEQAKDRDLPTIGIFPESAQGKALPTDVLDLRIAVPPFFGKSDWGDESLLFAKVAAGIIVIGGGAGTTLELAHAMKINEDRIRNKETPIFISPIKGFGGIADIIDAVRVFKANVVNECTPNVPNYENGTAAARFLLDRLKIGDYQPEDSHIRRFVIKRIPGCPDILPDEFRTREQIVRTMRSVVESFGYVPIDTPALERTDLLDGIAGEEINRQIFKFVDIDRSPVSLRYDHTVPLARFIAEHRSEIGLPFRRYQMGPVWRMEPSSEQGRGRQFTQFDFDLVGSEGLIGEIDTLHILYSILRDLGLHNFIIRINNVKFFEFLFGALEMQDKMRVVLAAIDRAWKSTPSLDQVLHELEGDFSLSSRQVEVMRRFFSAESQRPMDVIDHIHDFCQSTGQQCDAIVEMRSLFQTLIDIGLPDDVLSLDLSLTRGSFEYYSGLLCEVSLPATPTFGSLGGGGRYDGLLGRYLGSTEPPVPAIGASLGIERLMLALHAAGALEAPAGAAHVLIAGSTATDLALLHLASELRKRGTRTEVYPGQGSLQTFLGYAQLRHQQLIVTAEAESVGPSLFTLFQTSDGQEVATALARDELLAQLARRLDRK